MIKRIVFALIFFMLVIGTGRIVKDTFQLTVSNQVAVDQVESLDSPAVMVRSVSGFYKYITLLSLLFAFGGAWYILPIKQIKEKIKKSQQQET